jgi:hypothetical protein
MTLPAPSIDAFTPLRLTYSESKQWMRDRRQWYLGTYRGLQKRAIDTPFNPLDLGTAYHDALALYYEDSKNDPLAFVTAQYDSLIAETEYVKDAQKAKDLITAMVGGYLEWLEETGADADLIIEGSESMVEVKLVPGITLLSKLDAPVTRRSDGSKLALEHKTTASLDAPLALLKLDRQFLTEHLARFLMLQAQGATADEAHHLCTGILWNGARKVKRGPTAKPPFYARVDVLHNIVELRNHWKHMVAIGREIQYARWLLDAGVSHHIVCPPNPTRDSTWDDPFFKISVMLDDGSDAEGAIEELYEKHDPLERYQGAVPIGLA